MKKVLSVALTSIFIGHQSGSTQAMNMSLSDFQQACDVRNVTSCNIPNYGSVVYNNTDDLWYNSTQFTNINQFIPTTQNSTADEMVISAGLTFGTGLVLGVAAPIIGAIGAKVADYIAYRCRWFGADKLDKIPVIETDLGVVKDILKSKKPAKKNTIQSNYISTSVDVDDSITNIKENNIIEDINTDLKTVQGDMQKMSGNISSINTNLGTKAPQTDVDNLNARVVRLETELTKKINDIRDIQKITFDDTKNMTLRLETEIETIKSSITNTHDTVVTVMEQIKQLKATDTENTNLLKSFLDELNQLKGQVKPKQPPALSSNSQ